MKNFIVSIVAALALAIFGLEPAFADEPPKPLEPGLLGLESTVGQVDKAVDKAR